MKAINAMGDTLEDRRSEIRSEASEALLQVLDEIQEWFDGCATNSIMSHWQLGDKVNRVYEEVLARRGGRYGVHAIEDICQYFAWGSGMIHKSMNLAKAYSQSEIEALCAIRMKDGQALFYSHVCALLERFSSALHMDIITMNLDGWGIASLRRQRMRPYSIDVRQRIVAAVEAGEHTLGALAELFSVDISTIVRLLQRFRSTGSVQPKPHAGGPHPKVDSQATARLLELVRQQPDATLAELRDRLGVDCSIVAIFRALKRKGITRKKKTRFAEERDSPRVQEQRRAFCKEMATVNANHVVFVDEAGTTTAMSRTYGRAAAGERVQATVPGAWKKVTLISGMRGSGVIAPMALPGATDRLVFDTYVEQALVPELRAGDVVVWDNLSAHDSASAKAAIEAAGARVVPLPAYSPDLTPIEEMFGKVKEGLRSIAARTVEGVIDAMGKVLNQITPGDILGWFHDRCPYAMQS